jgi:predicted DCC family thiol-disulfide oxidoreductase YuxK
MKKNSTVKVIYDGECPFCSNFVRLSNLKRIGYQVILINAREADNDVVRKLSKSYDLDDGMIVIVDNEILYGSTAARFLSTGFKRTNLLALIYYTFLHNKKVSEVIYPWLVRGRKFYFRILGKRLINDD